MDGGDTALGLRLGGRQHGELDTVGSQHFEGLDIDSGFGQPHAFGVAIEAVLEVSQTPDHLGLLVSAIGQRHDHVVVNLGDGGAVSGEALLAGNVGVEDGLVGFGSAVGHPGEKRGADVKADPGVVVNDAGDAVVGGQDAGGGVGRVTLRINALVPVVIGIRGILLLNNFKPRILAGRLIEVTMNAKITVHKKVARNMKE